MSAKEGKKDKLSQPPGSSGKPVIKVQRVVAFRATKLPENAGQAQLNCPAEILRAFQDLLVGTPILGATFLNPYTNKMEAFPTDARQLTSRHLQILARIEQVNTSGVMNTALYQGLLTNQQIATLRCLVKATNVAGVVEVKAVGGYGSKKTELKTSQKTILIDQAGLQWQGDLHNTGGLLFYPAQAALPSGYSA